MGTTGARGIDRSEASLIAGQAGNLHMNSKREVPRGRAKESRAERTEIVQSHSEAGLYPEKPKVGM